MKNPREGLPSAFKVIGTGYLDMKGEKCLRTSLHRMPLDQNGVLETVRFSWPVVRHQGQNRMIPFSLLVDWSLSSPSAGFFGGGD